MFLVYIEALFVGVGIIKTKRNEGENDLLDETLIDHFTVALSLDKTQDGAGEFGIFTLYRQEEMRFPLCKGKLQIKGQVDHDGQARA